MGKGAQKGVFAVDLFQIALHELHALQGGTAQQRRIIRRDRKLVGGEFGPVQPKEAVYAALNGGTPEHIGGLEQPGQDPPLKDAHRPQLLPHPAKAFVVQLAQRPCFQRRRRVLRGRKALQRCAQHHLQRAQHLPGHFHRQGSAPFPHVLNRHPAKQLRQLRLQAGKIAFCQKAAGKRIFRQRSEIIPGPKPRRVDGMKSRRQVCRQPFLRSPLVFVHFPIYIHESSSGRPPCRRCRGRRSRKQSPINSMQP